MVRNRILFSKQDNQNLGNQMARMIPSCIAPDIKSTGEKLIFEYFKSDPETKNWVILHSLNLSSHIKRVYGEIDFVVLAPKLGIFCLEVKSGKVKRQDGVWVITDRYGNIHKKHIGPFEQSRDGMFSLIEMIKKHFGVQSKLWRLIYGFGVMFPHINFEFQGVEYEQSQIYDRSSRREPISNYIKSLSKFTYNHLSECAWFKGHESLPTKDDIKQLVNYLRGNFEVFVSKHDYIEDCEEYICSYTEKQYEILDQISDNPRLLINGAAGTGKTLLAIEAAKRLAHQGCRIAFFCYNRLLSEWVRHKLSFYEDIQILVMSFHQYLFSNATKNNHLEHTSKSDEFYTCDLPLLALEAIDQIGIRKYDYVIIDEGQDLIRSEYLDVVDAILNGGIAGGRWQIYSDFLQQSIYGDYTPSEMYEELEKRGSYFRLNLNVNCRNTKPIGEETSMITHFPSPVYMSSNIDGEEVDYYFSKNNQNQIDILDKILKNYMKHKVPLKAITILSPFKLSNSPVSCYSSKYIKITELDPSNISIDNIQCVTYATIHSFKGLENSIIIIVDINRELFEKNKMLLYTAMSRAKAKLILILDDDVKELYDSIIKMRIEKL